MLFAAVAVAIGGDLVAVPDSGWMLLLLLMMMLVYRLTRLKIENESFFFSNSYYEVDGGWRMKDGGGGKDRVVSDCSIAGCRRLAWLAEREKNEGLCLLPCCCRCCCRCCFFYVLMFLPLPSVRYCPRPLRLFSPGGDI